MNLNSKIVFDFGVALFLSSIFCILLIHQLLESGVGNNVTLQEFLQDPESVIFCLFISCFIFVSWLMRGTNNRTILFCWAAGITAHQFIFWSLYELFYHQSLNIYVLNFAGALSSIPIVVFLRYRMTYSIIVLEQIGKLGFFKQHVSNALRKIKTTDFEFCMKKVLFVGFAIEIVYGFYQTAYALYYNIPLDGSIYEHLIQFDSWDPYDLYNSLMNLVSVSYILIMLFFVVRDNNERDAFMYGSTKQDKRQIALKILEETREKVRKKDSKKRDQD